ncbi:MAG: type II CRISPR RNA-guided endonuclease Cas9, partial [Desulfitobacteriaceae bacterium]
MKKVFGEYYLGLDIGTDSVGWAVTNQAYHLQRLNRKDMWGVRLFESGKTAAERRGYRTSRRRNDRQNQRIGLLQELFADEICKVDPGFYQRLADSRFYVDDKRINQPNTLFNDADFNDKDFHKKYPTIYHLRKALIEGCDQIYDVRLVYLAVAHIIKHRGHFLLEVENITDNSSFNSLFIELERCLYDELDITFSSDAASKVADILRKGGDISSKKRALESVLGRECKEKISFIALLSGATVKLADLFADESYNSPEVIKVSFSGNQYDESTDIYAATLNDRMCCIEAAKAVYDWALLSHILQDMDPNLSYLSSAMIMTYDKHRSDLRLLKTIYKRHCSKAEFKEMFSDNEQAANYYAYIGKSIAKEKNRSGCSIEDFYKYIKSKLQKFKDSDTDVQKMLQEIGNGKFLPKQRSGNNSVIPYQLHLKELKVILDNSANYLTFMYKCDSEGISTREKIQMLLTFRIPYYVGPLNDAHKTNDSRSKCWIVKKSTEQIYPWNFDRVVDLDACQEAFISKMTNKCTYLVGKDILPKNSLLYSKFMVLNELNNLRISGEKATVEIKQRIYTDLFLRLRKVTQKRLKDYLLAEGYLEKTDEISGIDGDFKASLTSYIDLAKKLGEKVKDSDLAEEIIRTLVLFGKDKNAVEKRLRNRFSSKLSDEEIRKVATLKYSGWGRFSKELLTEVYNIEQSTGESMSIIEKMYSTNENLMQLLSGNYGYKNEIDRRNAEVNGQNVTMNYDDLVESLYCSPAVKRGILQTLTIVEEIRKIMDHPPKKVFVEVAREDGEKRRTISRKNKLIELYEKCKNEEHDWITELEAKTDGELRKDKLYLYYTQMGRCMYSDEKIELSQLYDNSIYDIDHIFPQSKTKDDSIDNRVLVKKGLNKIKDNRYPLPASFKTSITRTLWKRLFEMELMSKTKYDRLIREEEFSDDELAGFINRQLVETRQSTKAVVEVLNRIYSSNETEIVYVKAGNVSDFRRNNGFVKVRELNDYHHAKDAFINIVVGNVYNTKFTNNPLNFIKDAKHPQYSL